MEFQLNAAGKRIIPGDFKKQLLKELAGGASMADLARRYQVPIQNIVRWRRLEVQSGEAKFKQEIAKSAQPAKETELWAEYRREQCQKVVDGKFRLGGNLVVHFGS